MTSLETALDEIGCVLEELGFHYMLIGGLAVAAWGEPRTTLDVNICVWVPEDLGAAVEALSKELVPAVPDPVSFARRTRVLPLISKAGVRVDLVFAAFPFEKEMIDRATPKPVGSRSIPVATVEDLILLKSVSTRTRDREDVALLFARFREVLDADYLRARLTEFAEALDRPDLLDIMNES